MINLLSSYSVEQYLYKPLTLYHRIRTFHKLTSFYIYSITLFYMTLTHICICTCLMILIVFLLLRCIPIFTILNIINPSLFNILTYFLILILINDPIIYKKHKCTLINIRITINYNQWHVLLQQFLYLFSYKNTICFLYNGIYFYLQCPYFIIRGYLIHISYLILNKLLFITSTHEDILYNYLNYYLPYTYRSYLCCIITFIITLSFNYIYMTKLKLNNILVAIYFKNLQIFKVNKLELLLQILIIFLQDLIHYCTVISCVIYYKQSYPPYKIVRFNH